MTTQTPPVDKLRILLVEDTVLMADQLRELLQQTLNDPQIVVACTEDEAVATAGLYAPDVVILDLKLKEGTGFGALRTIKASDDPPVTIVLTNYALPQYRAFAELIGADYFLDKAYDLTMLTDILSTLPSADRNGPPVTRH